MIHRALESLSAKPALFIAPVLALLALSFYYVDTKRECTSQAQYRDHLLRAVTQAADSGSQLKLAPVSGFSWERVKGFENFKPQHERNTCYFGWDWSSATRESLINDGLLSIMLFFRDGAIVRYIEFRNDQLSIEEFSKGLEPDAAVFDVSKTSGNGYRLTIADNRE